MILWLDSPLTITTGAAWVRRQDAAFWQIFRQPFGTRQNLNRATWSGDGSSPTIEFYQNEIDGIFEIWRRAVAAPFLSCTERQPENEISAKIVFFSLLK